MGRGRGCLRFVFFYCRVVGAGMGACCGLGQGDRRRKRGGLPSSCLACLPCCGRRTEEEAGSWLRSVGVVGSGTPLRPSRFGCSRPVGCECGGVVL